MGSLNGQRLVFICFRFCGLTPIRLDLVDGGQNRVSHYRTSGPFILLSFSSHALFPLRSLIIIQRQPGVRSRIHLKIPDRDQSTKIYQKQFRQRSDNRCILAIYSCTFLQIVTFKTFLMLFCYKISAEIPFLRTLTRV